AASRAFGQMPEPGRELDQIRAFLTGQGPIAIVDLPWIPVFLLPCALILPWLGLLALIGAVVLAGATLLTEQASRAPAREANRMTRARSFAVEADRRNAETTAAMGMETALSRRWLSLNAGYVAVMERSSDVVNFYTSVSKVTRMMLQSAALGLGAYLVIRQELMPGAMIAASVMMARALAPIETAIANWRSFVAARQSAQAEPRACWGRYRPGQDGAAEAATGTHRRGHRRVSSRRYVRDPRQHQLQPFGGGGKGGHRAQRFGRNLARGDFCRAMAAGGGGPA